MILFGNVFTHAALSFNLHISPCAQRGSADGVRAFDETKDISNADCSDTEKVGIRSVFKRELSAI